jgi:predicted RND superfamily exporter protein
VAKGPHKESHSALERALGAGVAAICRWSVKHRKLVIVLLLFSTLAFSFGLTKIYVRSADYDLMPDGHPSTIANTHALSEVPGYRSVETIWMETRPHSGPDGKPLNITSSDSIRAAEELEDFIKAETKDAHGNPAIAYTYSLAYLVKLVNYTASGIPNPACNIQPPSPLPPLPINFTNLPGQVCTPVPPTLSAFALPKDNTTIQRDYQLIATANFAAIQGVVNEGFNGTIVIFMYDFNLTKEGPAGVLPASASFLKAVHDYQDHACAQSKIRAGRESLVNCPHIYVLGEAINAHMTELANADFIKWGPIVFVVTLFVLVFAFNDIVSTGIAALAFTMGLVWTYGFMGYLKMPLTFFGLLIVPITLGVGKEYAIYVTNQYQQYRAEGRDDVEAFGLVGRRAGAALLIASLTSMVGVLTMTLANFFIMRDLAILTTFSFGALFVIAVTFIPAAQSLRNPRRKPRPFKGSAAMGALAVGLRRHRILTIVAAVVITGALAVESTHIQEYFGISGGFRKGDYLETSYNYYNQVLGGSGTELIVIETTPGGVGDPATIDYLRHMDTSLRSDTRTIPKASNVNSLVIALDTYYSLKDGLANPKALNGPLSSNGVPGIPSSNIPQDRDRVDADIRAMFDHPVWGALAALFTGKTGNVVVTHVFYHIGSETYEGLKKDWDSLNHDISPQQVHRPSTVQHVNLVGTQDTFYLYVTYGQPWLEYVGYMASALTLLVAVFVVGRMRDLLAVVPAAVAFGSYFGGVFNQDKTGFTLYGHTYPLLITLAIATTLLTMVLLAVLRSRDVAAIMIPMLLASVWWAGLLPLFNIKASLTLMLPTVFLISVGSDYAIQYVWNFKQVGNMRDVYVSTGKANLYVVAATVIAFLLFVPMKLVLSSQGALAAALAIVTIFVVTTLLVPLFYPLGDAVQADNEATLEPAEATPPLVAERRRKTA